MEGNIESGSSDPTMMTLDEPVSVTIKRDLTAIYNKLYHVMLPRATGEETIKQLRDWDLWGPLFICLGLAIVLSLQANSNQVSTMFTFVFVLITLGSVVVTINGQLLGAKISFFQSACILGYCVTPLFLTSLICFLFNYAPIRFILVLIGYLWSNKASVLFMSQMISPQRKVLAVYPVFLFYVSIALLIFFN